MLQGAIISSVNVAEVISKLFERGMESDMARSLVTDTGIEVISFDLEQAQRAGALRGETRLRGLSLGDRACLALASWSGGRAVSADQAWTSVSDLGIKVMLFREN